MDQSVKITGQASSSSRAYYRDPFSGELVEVLISEIWGNRAYVHSVDGSLLRENWFGMVSYVEVKQVSLSEIVVEPVFFS